MRDSRKVGHAASKTNEGEQKGGRPSTSGNIALDMTFKTYL